MSTVGSAILAAASGHTAILADNLFTQGGYKKLPSYTELPDVIRVILSVATEFTNSETKDMGNLGSSFNMVVASEDLQGHCREFNPPTVNNIQHETKRQRTTPQEIRGAGSY